MDKPSLRYFACGKTSHNLALIYKNVSKQNRVFPAGAFLYTNTTGDMVLYDTGYADSMDGTGWFGKLYCKLLPPNIKQNETIDVQLQQINVNPQSIGHVVVSHLHPDHIGGIKYFPNSTFVIAEQTLEALDKHRLRDGIIPELLPKWFDKAPKIILNESAMDRPTGTVVRGHDLLADGNFIISSLPGHAAGHIGALVEKRVFLAGDASWGGDLLNHSEQIRPLPRFITHNFESYKQTANTLQKLGEKGIKLCFSHDTYSASELL